MARRLTTQEFINKSRDVHGDLYDYSKVAYLNSYTKVEIICRDHGVFLQKPNSHLEGKRCHICYESNRKGTKESFVKKAVAKHGERYDYSDVTYINNRTKVNIKCKVHGVFKQAPSGHLSGSGCPVCSGNIVAREDVSHIKVPEGAVAVPINKGRYVIIDKEDYNLVSKHNWTYSKGYATNGRVGFMHRLIMNTPDSLVVDHINRDTLDNRKANLRNCIRAENNRNSVPHKNSSSKYKGVTWARWANKWRAQIGGLHIGYFNSEIEAAKAYDLEAKKHHGDFSLTNF